MTPPVTERIPVGLSTSSAFPEGLERAFALAAELGYDGIELMVTADRVTQDPARILALAAEHGVPVLSVHSPCLAISARVWGTDPIGKVERSLDLAAEIGAGVVVAHPPFAWQRRAAGRFPEEVAELSESTAADAGITIAIENMYPASVLRRAVSPYRPDWNVTATGYDAYTLDISHTAVAGIDAVDLAREMGAGLAHVHLGDGSGAGHDEHLVPGRGSARCADVLTGLADGSLGGAAGSGGDADGDDAGGDFDASDRALAAGPASALIGPASTAVGPASTAADQGSAGRGRYTGVVILEVSTRTVEPEERRADLAESLAFAREHLGKF